MKNGVGQRLTERGFNLKFLAGGAVHAAGHFHNALDHGTDAGWVGVERDLDAYHQFVAINSIGKGQSASAPSPPSIASVTLTGMVLPVKT